MKPSKLFDVSEADLIPLWLADMVLQVIDDNQCTPYALTPALKKIKNR